MDFFYSIMTNMTWSLATSHLLSSPLHFPCSSLHSAGLLPFYLTHQALTLALLYFLFLQPGESCSYLLKMCSLGLFRSLLSFHLLREAFPRPPYPISTSTTLCLSLLFSIALYSHFCYMSTRLLSVAPTAR